MLASAPMVAMLPPTCPCDPGAGLFNWPPPVLPSGPVIELSAPTTSPIGITCSPRDESLLHEVVFDQDVPRQVAEYLVAYLPPDCPATTPASGVRVIDASATVVERADPPQPSLSADPLPDRRSDDVAVFSYGNTRMAMLDRPSREQFTLSVSRLMDSTLLFLRGEIDEATFAKSHQSYFQAVRKTAGYEPSGGWPLPKNTRHYPASQQYRNQQSTQDLATKGQCLGRLLKEWVGIDCAPTSDTYQHGQYRYILKPWYGINCDGLFVEIEAPDGRSWIRSQIAFSPNDLQTRIREIGEEYERRVAMGSVDSLATRIDARRQTLNHEAIHAVKKNLFGEVIDQKVSGANV